MISPTIQPSPPLSQPPPQSQLPKELKLLRFSSFSQPLFVIFDDNVDGDYDDEIIEDLSHSPITTTIPIATTTVPINISSTSVKTLQNQESSHFDKWFDIITKRIIFSNSSNDTSSSFDILK
ncbi:hypothetical protein Glove_313g44 [Diversispora epigaea]|uniref:Uncharacterized protein n=1 Tax=Diversispora epigaea TaxID=1348612 RepID=A0A397HQX4_9GLOM|nr:hypothetical protein Glove_313g44 [Diversispora epigaea]